MKITSDKQVPQTGVFNVISLIAVSLVWGHMLSLVSLWFLPLTILLALVGWGSELRNVTELKTNFRN
jgi:hypothetical protein